MTVRTLASGMLAIAGVYAALSASADMIEITLDEGSRTSATLARCSAFDLLFGVQDCTYNASKNPALGLGPWVGPRTADGFFPLLEGQVFTNTGIPANPQGVPLSGTLQIDTRGTLSCADDVLSGTVTMAPFTRNFAGNNARVTDNFFGGLVQVIEPSPFASGVPNAAGGCDYTLGAQGVPELLTGNYGDFPGNAPGGTQPGASTELVWTGPASAALSRFAGTTTPNPGARAAAQPTENYACFRAEFSFCLSTSTAPLISSDHTFAWSLPAKASWNNILGNLSTDASGNLVEAFLYLVHDDFEVGSFPGQKITWFAYTATLSGSCTADCPSGEPQARDDNAQTLVDVAVSIDVLANDANLGQAVSVAVSALPASGSAVVTGSPGTPDAIRIIYTPDSGFAGEDSFGYTVSGEFGELAATVTVTVLVPGANADAALTVRGGPVTVDVLANDVGFDDPVKLELLLPPEAGGTVEVVDAEGQPVPDGIGAQAALRLRYTPPGNQPVGEDLVDRFTYQVTGPMEIRTGEAYRLASVVRVSLLAEVPAADFSPDALAIVDSNQAVTVTGVAWSSNFPIPGFAYQGDWSTMLGTAVDLVKIAENCEQDSITEPDLMVDNCANDWNALLGDWRSGFDSNGQASGTCEAICGMADGRVLTGEPLSLINVAVDEDTLRIVRRSRLSSNPDSALFNAPVEDIFVFTRELSQVPPATAIPAPGALQDTAEVTVTVLDRELLDDVLSIPVGEPADIDVLANDRGLVAPVTLTVISGPAGGSVEVLGSPGAPEALRLRYTPGAGFRGVDTLVYQVSDALGVDSATLRIGVGLAADDSAATAQGVPVEIAPLANDLGFSSPVTVTISEPPSSGSVQLFGSPGDAAGVLLLYTPAAGVPAGPALRATDSFGYTVTDGVFTASATVHVDVFVDADGDGVPDDIDNCLGVFNPDQRDTNGNGFGNRCDADFNGDGVVNFADLAILRGRFTTSDPDADLNGDGVVNFADLAIFQSLFGRPPGPSALVP